MAKDKQRFRDAVRIGSSKMAPRPLLEGCTNTTGYAYVAPSATAPVVRSPGQGKSAATVARVGFEVEEFTAARIWFGGVGAGGTINYTVIGFYQIGETWFSHPIAAGVATLGTSTAITLDLGVATGDLLADTITETLANPGVRPYSPADDTIAHLDVDIRNFQVVQVHLDIAATTTAMNCYYQRFEAGSNLTTGDIEVDVAALEVLSTAANVDLAAIEVLATAIKSALAGTVAAGDPTVHTLNAGANTVLLAASATREIVTVTSMSADTVMYISAGDVAESTKGIPLPFIVAGGVGGSVTFTGAAAKLAINAFSAAADSAAVWAGSSA